MKVTMIIPDKDYERMVKSGRRMRGSLGLISPRVMDMRLYADGQRNRRELVWRKLNHGRVSVNPKAMTARVSMFFNLTETGLCPWKQVKLESEVASDFLYDNDL